ncbi:endonuclease/exonuclease/phosphatase family protein [Vibrio maerlii]|uniref:endonuclease/exonuclease/phosphatase family protein n=1 Tax=Vibrio maerlii TaxID=2231648 RepID=UPI000E3DE3EA|nr:endonuclease/exonuclease/phosphatase family protein [Vibrio maerlii]
MQTNQTLTFATANLFNFVAPPDAFYDFENIYEAEAWTEKCRWTKEKFAELNADIVGLQEVFSIEAAKSMMAEIGYAHFAAVDTPHVEDDYIFSKPVVAIASRYPITQCETATEVVSLVENYHTTFPGFSRKPIKATIDVPNIGEVAVYVCHLKSQRAAEGKDKDLEHPLLGRWLSSQQRGWEAVMLRLFMEQEYQRHPIPTLLMGDMNQGLESSITGQLTQNLSDESRLTLEDSWSIYTSRNTDTKRTPTHYHFSKGNVLDYILMSQEFQPDSQYSLADVIHYQVIDQHLVNPIFEKDKQASDHAFVAVTVNFIL